MRVANGQHRHAGTRPRRVFVMPEDTYFSFASTLPPPPRRKGSVKMHEVRGRIGDAACVARRYPLTSLVLAFQS